MWAKIKGYKVLVFNVFVTAALAGVEVTSYLTGVRWGDVFDPQTALWITVGVAVVNIVLRFLTTGPVGSPK
jgi:hypothetical protein